MGYAEAIGHLMTLVTPNVEVHFRFQNFALNENKVWEGLTYSFMPFGFSGVTITADGSNMEATLVFPNNSLSRDWATRCVEEFWVARVRTMVMSPAGEPEALLSRYVAQVTSATWDETALSLRLGSVLDSVRGNVPNRRLNRNLVGALPVTNSLRL